MALDDFSALQFAPPATVIILAETKATTFYNVFCPLILR